MEKGGGIRPCETLATVLNIFIQREVLIPILQRQEEMS
jgi:hypothetical protein